MSEPEEPQVRVVDRRWWAQGDTSVDEREQSSVRKPSYVEDLERRLADTTAQLQAMAVEHRRALEEFEQAKGRIRRDVNREAERRKRAVLVEFLEVVDNLDRAIAADPERTSPLFRGVELVRDQFIAKLDAFGVSRIAAVGEPFDANRHDAVSMEPVADPAQDGRVVRVLKEGYAIGDELLRPATVIVGTRA